MNVKNENDIHKRIYNFVISVLNFNKKIPKSPESSVIIYQLTKSVTSMGANDQEADGSITKKDFIHKYSIVKKEGKETIYWLCIIRDTNNLLTEEARVLINECTEIVKIVSTIMYNTQTNSK